MVRLGYILYGLLGACAVVYALYAAGGIALYAGGYFAKSVQPRAPLAFAAQMAAVAAGCFLAGRLCRFILAGT